MICCDGTGNGVGDGTTNVLKLFRILAKHTDQRVFYSPGVGTVGYENAWQRSKQRALGVFGLMTGYGLDQDVLAAYRFLSATYEPGDRIWLFGFSRGAYAVRVLAALTEVVGLMPSDQLNLAGHAFSAYKRASVESRRRASNASDPIPEVLQAAWEFGTITGTRPVRIEFMGVWDTVASVIVPRAGTFLPAIQTLRYTRRNRSVKAFRQAIAIDEKRRMFRLNRWIEPQPFRPDPFDAASEIPQDIKQVWFAGVHADVGGGYGDAEPTSSRFSMRWMADEAYLKGLDMDRELLDLLAPDWKSGPETISGESGNRLGSIHNSMTGLWPILEFVPRDERWREWPARRSFLGRYLPRSEPRVLPAGALVHWSALKRVSDVSAYRPENLNLREVVREGSEDEPPLPSVQA